MGHQTAVATPGRRVGATSLSLVLMFAVLVAVALTADACVRPTLNGRIPAVRSTAGVALLCLMVLTAWGLLMLVIGKAAGAAIIVGGFATLLATVSAAKRRVLGEPLLFSDFALLFAVFRHPQFYFSALARWQRSALLVCAPLVLLLLAWAILHGSQVERVWGLAISAGSAIGIALMLRLPAVTRLAQVPDADADVARHGLIATLFLHAVRWWQTPDPAPLHVIDGSTFAQDNRLIVVIQCESFADPIELFDDNALALPSLVAARRRARQWGDLAVSGFGAYTMRTEYGVIFGRSEGQLGFRRFDPYLTALGETSFALPARLAPGNWRSLFVHPHDMRFYNRAEILTAGGFAELVGEERFAPPRKGEGRYVSDAAIADAIVDLAQAAVGPTLIYAVTIENHGPWDAGGGDLREGYLRLVRNGDAMLGSLIERLDRLEQPVTLVFFGDHRPSIPGHVQPGGDRHTPYVIVDLAQGSRGDDGSSAAQPVGLTPAGLHQAIFESALAR